MVEIQGEAALVIVTDSQHELEEAAARPYDLAVAESIHHWILELHGEDPTYQRRELEAPWPVPRSGGEFSLLLGDLFGSVVVSRATT